MATPMRFQPGRNELCVICQVSDRNDRYQLPCGHSFHCGCISGWFSTCLDQGNAVSCPICRGVVNDDEFIAYVVGNP